MAYQGKYQQELSIFFLKPRYHAPPNNADRLTADIVFLALSLLFVSLYEPAVARFKP